MLSAKGQFGPLYLVRDKEEEWVLKVIDKKELELYDVVRFAVDEGKVLEEVSCPFVIEMGRRFQSPNYIYYLDECVKGRDLYDILKEIGLLST
jgi:cGMP-dependent protein kinase